MVAGPVRYENFPGWYSWIKWVLPLALALTAGGLMGGILTGWLGSFGYLDAAVQFVATQQGFPAMAMVGMMSGFVASVVGAISLAAVRIGLFFVTEDIATHNINRATQFQEQLEAAQNQLEEERANFNETIARLDDQKQQALAQYHQLLGRTGNAEKPARKAAHREDAHHGARKRAHPAPVEDAANEPTQERVSVIGRRKARRT